MKNYEKYDDLKEFLLTTEIVVGNGITGEEMSIGFPVTLQARGRLFQNELGLNVIEIIKNDEVEEPYGIYDILIQISLFSDLIKAFLSTDADITYVNMRAFVEYDGNEYEYNNLLELENEEIVDVSTTKKISLKYFERDNITEMIKLKLINDVKKLVNSKKVKAKKYEKN